jgi:hypothetical protein
MSEIKHNKWKRKIDDLLIEKAKKKMVEWKKQKEELEAAIKEHEAKINLVPESDMMEEANSLDVREDELVTLEREIMDHTSLSKPENLDDFTVTLDKIGRDRKAFVKVITSEEETHKRFSEDLAEILKENKMKIQNPTTMATFEDFGKFRVKLRLTEALGFREGDQFFVAYRKMMCFKKHENLVMMVGILNSAKTAFKLASLTTSRTVVYTVDIKDSISVSLVKGLMACASLSKTVRNICSLQTHCEKCDVKKPAEMYYDLNIRQKLSFVHSITYHIVELGDNETLNIVKTITPDSRYVKDDYTLLAIDHMSV